MATMTIIFEDGQEEGAVNVKWVFDPPIEDGQEATPAQEAGLRTCAYLKELFAPVTAKKVSPGIYEDAAGALHFNVPELLDAMNVQDTPRNRDICVEQARRVVAEKWPNTSVEVLG